MSRWNRVAALATVVALGLPATAMAQEADGQGAVGPTVDFNDYVVQAVADTARFPRGGEYGRRPVVHGKPERGNVAGIRQRLRYRDPDGGTWSMSPYSTRATNCSGITFEVLFVAYQRFAEATGTPMLNGMSADELRELQGWWFRATRDPDTGEVSDGPPSGIVLSDLGVEVERIENARPGDFVQWYTGEDQRGGHSVVFLGWIDDQHQRFRYFSSNSRRGSAYGVKEGTKDVDGLLDLWVARVIPPPVRRAPAGVVEEPAPDPAPAGQPADDDAAQDRRLDDQE